MNTKTFDTFWDKNKPYLVRLVADLQREIDDNFRAYEDDDEPGMYITISVNANCTTWSYQTGDNSYTGSCYGDPYWGVGAIYRDSDPAEVAQSLIDDLADAIGDWETD